MFAAFVAWRCREEPKAERREEFVAYWNACANQRRAAAAFWDGYLRATTDAERRARLRRCREALERIQPYQPPGTDPRVADAVAEERRVWLKLVDSEEQHVGSRSPDEAGLSQLMEEIDAADSRLLSARNLLASEVGGVDVIK